MQLFKRLFIVLVSLFLVFSVYSSSVCALGSGYVIYDYTWCPGTMSINERSVSTGESVISERFVKYLSSSWSKASSYTWSRSVSFSGSVSAGVSSQVSSDVLGSLGLSLSYTETYGLATTIPANSRYYTKLGFASDFHRQKFYYTQKINGKETQSYSGYIDTPAGDTYLVVYTK